MGVLFSDSGVTSTLGRSMLQGTMLAIDEVNANGGLEGRELVGVHHDAKSTPSLYAQIAERMIVEDKVSVIFGCYMSSTRKAVLPVVESRNCVLFYPTLYEGFEFSNNVVYTGAAPNQNSVQLAEFMTSAFGPRVYLVGSDYIFPYESNRIMGELVQQRQGGEKVGERYVALDATQREFDVIMQDIQQTQPDFIFSTVVGDATSLLYRAFADAGLSAKSMPIASLTTSEAEIRQTGADVVAGHVTSAPYFQSIQSPANLRFLQRFFERFGDEAMPNLCSEAAYFQVHLFAEAFRQSGDDDIRALMPHVLGREFEAPQGRVRVDPQNHHTCLYPRIGVANPQGQFTIVREARRQVHPDPYMVTHSLGDWAARLESLPF